ncbi:glycosyltransferase family 4 protein [Frondihabitans australicus]|uniref:D-inositol 3-phosphate glycosyltransferase n=1 Tax=Frondihabitans australicus TaxID=386892 RepID=A0A495IIK3_9MICO|nr:glycosyltransferase family 4 protein [Frondihabitans australicus]RKR75248.1 glycosyl transferase family 1 [Frondihabitans australicus]
MSGMVSFSDSIAFVVPATIDDDERVSGGNLYDRRLRDGLRAAGLRVETVAVDAEGAAAAVRGLRGGRTVIVDGLAGSWAPAHLVELTRRAHVIVLAHMLPHTPAEWTAFCVADGVVATSEWTRAALVAHGVRRERVSVARPGVDERHRLAATTALSPGGGRLLCVGTLAEHKGQHALVAALGTLGDVAGWTLEVAGSADTDPAYASSLVTAALATAIADRLTFSGVVTGPALDRAYDRADLVVAPSLSESYGMAVAEAQARGIPVLVSDAGGLVEAARHADAALRVPAGDVPALAAALRRWLGDRDLRDALAAGARDRRHEARAWDDTVSDVVRALPRVARGARDEVPA